MKHLILTILIFSIILTTSCRNNDQHPLDVLRDAQISSAELSSHPMFLSTQSHLRQMPYSYRILTPIPMSVPSPQRIKPWLPIIIFLNSIETANSQNFTKSDGPIDPWNSRVGNIYVSVLIGIVIAGTIYLIYRCIKDFIDENRGPQNAPVVTNVSVMVNNYVNGFNPRRLNARASSVTVEDVLEWGELMREVIRPRVDPPMLLSPPCTPRTIPIVEYSLKCQ